MTTNIQNKSARMILSFVASALLLLTLASNAKADTVSGLQMKGLGNYVGKYLTVYYAIGGRATINTEGDQIKLRKVKAKKTIQITGDVVNLPSIDIPRTGFMFPYNIIVFSIHNTADFRWVNADGSIPENEQASGPTQYSVIDSLTKMEFESLQKANTQNYQFGEMKTNISPM
jgi:hypothetical protein